MSVRRAGDYIDLDYDKTWMDKSNNGPESPFRAIVGEAFV